MLWGEVYFSNSNSTITHLFFLLRFQSFNPYTIPLLSLSSRNRNKTRKEHWTMKRRMRRRKRTRREQTICTKNKQKMRRKRKTNRRWKHEASLNLIIKHWVFRAAQFFWSKWLMSAIFYKPCFWQNKQSTRVEIPSQGCPPKNMGLSENRAH